MGSLAFIVIQLIYKQKCLYSYITLMPSQVCASEMDLNTACSKRNERCSPLQQNPQANLTHHELHSPLAGGGGGG